MEDKNLGIVWDFQLAISRFASHFSSFFSLDRVIVVLFFCRVAQCTHAMRTHALIGDGTIPNSVNNISNGLGHAHTAHPLIAAPLITIHYLFMPWTRSTSMSVSSNRWQHQRAEEWWRCEAIWTHFGFSIFFAAFNKMYLLSSFWTVDVWPMAVSARHICILRSGWTVDCPPIRIDCTINGKYFTS